MHAGDEDSSDKPFDPSFRKLEDARRKGDIAKSNDLITAASYAGMLLVLLVAADTSLSKFASAMSWFLAQPDRITPVMFNGSAGAGLQGMAGHVALLLAPWFLVPVGTVLIAVLAQRSLVFTPSLLAPKISRISPLANARQKFGRNGLFEFGKSLVKLLVYALVIGFLLETQLDDLALTVWTDPKTTMVILFELLIAFMTTVVAIAVGIGAIDLLWQKQEHLRKNRMSYKELRDETKDAEGDPYLKQERRQRGHDLARNRMMLDVPKADVVIVNPTHYAVALKWSRKRGEAPICVAKGVDTVATRIRAIAAEHGVPLHSDPPSARALYATTEIGSEIAPDHYRAVAAAIRFAERIRRKAGRRHV